MLRSLALAIFLSLLSSPGVIAQDPAPPIPKVDPPAQIPAGSSPEALVVLGRAVAFQGGAKLSAEGAIKDLSVRLQADVWDYSKVPTQKVSIQVRRYLSLPSDDVEQFRSEWETTGGTQIYGYDGAYPREGLRFWYAELDQNRVLKESRFLSGTKYESDRKRIQDEVAETRYLMRLFFLGNLMGHRVVFTKLPDETVTVFKKDYACHVLRRDNRAPDSTEPPLSLWFDKKTHALLRATAHASADGDRSLIFSFRYDERVQPRVAGLLLPLKIEVREQPFRSPSSRVTSLATLLDEKAIAFNQNLAPALFKRPKLPR